MMEETLGFSCDENGIPNVWGTGFVGATYRLPISEIPENWQDDFEKHRWAYDGNSFVERDGWQQEWDDQVAAIVAADNQRAAEILAEKQKMQESQQG